MKLVNSIQCIKGTRLERVLKTSLLLLVSFYFFWLPSFSDRYPFNIITYPIFLMITALCAILLLSNKKVFICRNVFVIILIYLGTSLISTLFHIGTLGFNGFREWIRIFFLILSFLVLYNSFMLIGNKNTILVGILISLLLFSSYYVFVYFKDIILLLKGTEKRLGSYFNNVNTLSSFFAIGYIIALYFCFYSKIIIKPFVTLCCGVFIFLGYTTGSRQFLLSLFIATFIFLLWVFRKRKIALIVTTGSLLLIVVFVFTIPQLSFIKNKFLFLFNFADTKDLSAIQRLLMQYNALFEGGKCFVLGHGQSGFSFFTSFDGYSHNAYTNAYFESGLIGFLCLLSLIGLLLWNGRSLKSENFGIVVLFVVYYLVVGFFSVFFREKPFYVMLAFLCFLASSPKFINRLRINLAVIEI